MRYGVCVVRCTWWEHSAWWLPGISPSHFLVCWLHNTISSHVVFLCSPSHRPSHLCLRRRAGTVPQHRGWVLAWRRCLSNWTPTFASRRPSTAHRGRRSCRACLGQRGLRHQRWWRNLSTRRLPLRALRRCQLSLLGRGRAREVMGRARRVSAARARGAAVTGQRVVERRVGPERGRGPAGVGRMVRVYGTSCEH